MAGHSKWAQIKRKKQAKDEKKGKIFSKLSKEITLAVIAGGGIPDPDKNVRLRMAIEKAKTFRMPKENIERAIQRALGVGKDALQEYFYEGFAPYGIGLIIHAMTDNNNRTINEIRRILERNEGSLAVQGAVSHLFKKCASVSFEKGRVEEEKVFEFADKVDAFDIEEDNQFYTVYFPFEKLGESNEVLEKIGIEEVNPELNFKPQAFVKIEDPESAKKILALVEELENLDDVQQVFSNFDIKDELLEDSQ